MESAVMNLFATPLYRAQLGRQFTATEMQFFHSELADAVPAIANKSSINKNVLAAEAMADVRALLQACLDDYFLKIYNSSNQVCLKITQSWLAQSQRGEAHHSHVHPNSVVSGVLYINLAEQDGIDFYRSDDMVWYELLRKADTYYNAYKYFIKTEIGDILLFPSNLKHGVQAVTADISRISLSFNSFFAGELGRDGFANALSIRID
jgi:uncharacterized protein (TIGR02466 family)